jgi:hypothetical protein
VKQLLLDTNGMMDQIISVILSVTQQELNIVKISKAVLLAFTLASALTVIMGVHPLLLLTVLILFLFSQHVLHLV